MLHDEKMRERIGGRVSTEIETVSRPDSAPQGKKVGSHSLRTGPRLEILHGKAECKAGDALIDHEIFQKGSGDVGQREGI